MRPVHIALLLAALTVLPGCAMSDSDARSAEVRWENYVVEEDDIY